STSAKSSTWTRGSRMAPPRSGTAARTGRWCRKAALCRQPARTAFARSSAAGSSSKRSEQRRKKLMEIALVLFVIAIIFVVRAIKVVPQQNAWVVERLGKYHASLAPGLNILVPFVDKVAYKHSLKEIPLDVPSQICITR